MARVLTYTTEDFNIGFEPDYLFLSSNTYRYCAIKDSTIYQLNFMPTPISPETQLYKVINGVTKPKGWWYNTENNCLYFMDFEVETPPSKWYCCKYDLATDELVKSDVNLVVAMSIKDCICSAIYNFENNKIYYTIANYPNTENLASNGIPHIIVQNITDGSFITKYSTKTTPLTTGSYYPTLFSLGYLNYGVANISKINTDVVMYSYTDSSVEISNAASTSILDNNIYYYTYLSDGVDRYFINRNKTTSILKLRYENPSSGYSLSSTDITVEPPLYSNILKYENLDKYFYFRNNKIHYLEFVEYNAKLTIYDNAGNAIRYSTDNKAPITTIFFRYLLGQSTVNFDVGCVGGTTNYFTGTYSFDLPKNKTLVGYAYKPNSIYYDISVLTQVDIDKSEDLILYEVLDDYRPLKEGFKIKLYQNRGERNRVDKTKYLTNVGELFGVLREDSSITNLTITIQNNTQPTFNYCFIEKFNRYYYVSDVRSIRNNLWEIDLKVDVLMTYRTAIGECEGFITRNQYIYNDYIVDKKRVVEQGYDVEIIPITNNFLEPVSPYAPSAYNYVLNSFQAFVKEK